MLNFKSDIIWITKFLESKFESTKIQFVGPNHLSFQRSLFPSFTIIFQRVRGEWKEEEERKRERERDDGWINRKMIDRSIERI